MRSSNGTGFVLLSPYHWTATKLEIPLHIYGKHPNRLNHSPPRF